MTLNVELARHNMITQQVRPWDVLDERVLNVLSAVRREDFVSVASRNLAFADLSLPLGHGEIMMKPVVEGRVLQAVDPQPGESVLEIGSGSGFLTACLAKLAGEVVGIEQHADFAAAANTRLDTAGMANARIEAAEAVRGYTPKHQFDVMVVTGAVYELPQHWCGWIKPGGRIFAIAGQSPAQCATLYTQTAGNAWSTTALFETDLPYLRNAEPPQRFSL